MSLSKKLEELKKEHEKLIHKHINHHFKTNEEAEKYIDDNKVELKRLNDLTKEIETIEFQLKSPEEKKEFLEYQEKLRKKYEER